MKKLTLNLGRVKEVLTKEQMKRINGGYNCECRDGIHGKDVESDEECESAPVDCFDLCVIYCTPYGGV